MTEVVAALIWRKDRFFICRRPEEKKRGMLWEYVGGKIEPGETPEEALRRECREELDADVIVKDVFTEVTHVYPDITVHLTLFNAEFDHCTPRLKEHMGFLWIKPEEIPMYDFCPADKEINELIRKTFENQ